MSWMVAELPQKLSLELARDGSANVRYKPNDGSEITTSAVRWSAEGAGRACLKIFSRSSTGSSGNTWKHREGFGRRSGSN